MNVQQTIIKGIRELLFLHNYLVLPGFGGFVLKSSPSHYMGGGAMLAPPAKTVSFNGQLKQNDGLLSLWLQQNLKCSAQEALSHLHDFSGFCSGILQAKRRLSIKDIGFFYLDFEDNICFEPQQDANFLASSFGLAPIPLTMLETTQEVKKQAVFVNRQPAPAKAASPLLSRKMLVPLISGIVLFSLLALFVSTLRLNGNLHSSLFGNEKSAGYISFPYPDLPLVRNAGEAPAYIIDANGIASIEIGDKSIAVRAIPDIAPKPASRLPVHRRSREGFEIVLGCFGVHQNATRLVKKLEAQNVKAAISGKNLHGLYVVSAGSFENKSQASERLAEIKSVVAEAWIRTP
jgi:hypothetical protein